MGALKQIWRYDIYGHITDMLKYHNAGKWQGWKNSFLAWGLILEYFRPDSDKPHLYT